VGENLLGQGVNGGRAWRWRGLSAAAGLNVRGGRTAAYMPIAAARAGDEALRQLLLECVAGGKPTLEVVALCALKINDDQGRPP